MLSKQRNREGQERHTPKERNDEIKKANIFSLVAVVYVEVSIDSRVKNSSSTT